MSLNSIFPKNTHDGIEAAAIIQRIDQALEIQREKEPLREYLGASRLNASCSRALQYEYLHTKKDANKKLTGKTIRIFDAGHVFESLMVQWLRQAGLTLVTEDDEGNPFGFSALEGRMKGHVDGVITGAPSDLPFSTPCLFEAKSLNASHWNNLAKKGVALAMPVYAGQIALYQAYMESSFPDISQHPALFVAINKNTAELYLEWVPFNGRLAQDASDRGLRIVDACAAKEWLPRVSHDPHFFECKLCPYQQRCWAH